MKNISMDIGSFSKIQTWSTTFKGWDANQLHQEGILSCSIWIQTKSAVVKALFAIFTT